MTSRSIQVRSPHIGGHLLYHVAAHTSILGRHHLLLLRLSLLLAHIVVRLEDSLSGQLMPGTGTPSTTSSPVGLTLHLGLHHISSLASVSAGTQTQLLPDLPQSPLALLAWGTIREDMNIVLLQPPVSKVTIQLTVGRTAVVFWCRPRVM